MARFWVKGTVFTPILIDFYRNMVFQYIYWSFVVKSECDYNYYYIMASVYIIKVQIPLFLVLLQL